MASVLEVLILIVDAALSAPNHCSVSWRSALPVLNSRTDQKVQEVHSCRPTRASELLLKAVWQGTKLRSGKYITPNSVFKDSTAVTMNTGFSGQTSSKASKSLLQYYAGRTCLLNATEEFFKEIVLKCKKISRFLEK